MKLVELATSLTLALVFLIFQKNFVDLALHHELGVLPHFLFYFGYIIPVIMLIKSLQFKERLPALIYAVFTVLALSGTFSRVMDKLAFMNDESDLIQIAEIGANTECYISDVGCFNIPLCALDPRPWCNPINPDALRQLISVNTRIGHVDRTNDDPLIIVHSRAFTYFVFMEHQPPLPYYGLVNIDNLFCTEKVSDMWYLCESDWA
jgi:hypothetical protein